MFRFDKNLSSFSIGRARYKIKFGEHFKSNHSHSQNKPIRYILRDKL